MPANFMPQLKRKLAPHGFSVLALTLGLAACGVPAALADAYYDQGVKLYQKKDYARAAQYFEESIKNAPWESSSFYYAGLAYQSLGQWDKAKEKYRAVVEKFPGSQAYTNAEAVLKRIDPGYFTHRNDPKPSISSSAAASSTSSASSGSSASGEDQDMARVQFSGPQQSRVSGKKEGDKILVDVQVGSGQLKMVYDPGQADTIVTKKDAQKVGLTAAGGKAFAGVRLGQVTATNFPITVQEASENVLGRKFFRDFTATVDNATTSITMYKKGAQAAAGVAVPFTKQSGKMYIDVQINGRTCKMQFDPNSSDCAIPKSQARSLGLNVEESEKSNAYDIYTNPNGIQRGEAGYGDTTKEASTEATVKIGPFVKSGVRFKVEDGSTAQAKFGGSLIGSSQYTIDEAASVIRFRK